MHLVRRHGSAEEKVFGIHHGQPGERLIRIELKLPVLVPRAYALVVAHDAKSNDIISRLTGLTFARIIEEPVEGAGRFISKDPRGSGGKKDQVARDFRQLLPPGF